MSDAYYPSEGGGEFVDDMTRENTEARLERVNMEVCASAAAFNASMRKWFETYKTDHADVVFRKVAMDVLRGIVMKTPVDTGRARGNWQVGIDMTLIGEIAVQEVERTKRGKVSVKSANAAGMQAIAAGAKEIKTATLNNVIYIYNNVPYISFLEDGSSKQAPAGMVKLTLMEMGKMFEVKAGT